MMNKVQTMHSTLDAAVNNSPTGSAQARPNVMTADQWLDRVLYSGQVTRVAQHLALVIFVLANRQKQNGVSASLRDLEKVTGWGRSTLQDHLSELDVFVKVTTGKGRGKSMFEMQGIIEEAIGAALASAIELRQPDTKQVVASQPDATPDANPDTKPESAVDNQEPDASGCGQPAGHKSGEEAGRKPQIADTSKPSAYKDTRASKESPSEIAYSKREREELSPQKTSPHMNGVGFVISAKHDLIIPLEVVNGWRERFSAIPDLEAQMQKLASYILKGGIMHPGWMCPDGWMAGCLSNDNQRAIEDARIANAKVAKFGTKPAKLSRY